MTRTQCINEVDLPVQRVKRAFEQVADQIRDHILSGYVLAGDRLPTETEFCDRFSVSRSTVREALRMLASEGLICTRQGSSGGTFVASPTTEQVVDYLTRTLSLLAGARQVSVDDLVEARALLEVPAARQLARYRTEEIVERLRETIADHRESPHTFDSNRRFHEVVLQAAPNPLLRVMTEPLFTTLRARFLREEASAQFWRTVARDHERIAQAIDAGDEEATGLAMAEHLDNLRVTYRRIDRAEGAAATVTTQVERM